MTNVSTLRANPDGTESPTAAVSLAPNDSTAEDGRTKRRRRNRDAVIDSMVTLIREGNLEPTVTDIADHAAVSHRSIFRYFDDLTDLCRTTMAQEFQTAAHLSAIPDAGTGTLDHRIDQIMEKQLRTLQAMHNLGRVARARSIEIPDLDEWFTTVNEFRLDQVMTQFRPELEQMDEDRRQAISTAILLILSAESYDIQVRRFSFSPDELTDVWRTSIHALLA